MKKIFLLVLIMFAGFLPCFSLDLSMDISNNNSKKEIQNFINQYNKALDRHNVVMLTSFYDKNYKSSDGFNLDEISEMFKKTYMTYKNIKYKTKIKDITIENDKAIVKMYDETLAKIHYQENKKFRKNKKGLLEGKSSYIVYLKKYDDGWKIVSDSILEEETSLKYGIANNIDISLVAPQQVKKGEQYDLSLKINKPENIVAIASISKEEIKYPPEDTNIKFRKIPQEGELERLVTANSNNLDEYATASIGFTKVSLNEEKTKARVEILGMAYLMKRVNVEKNLLNNLAEE